jgi:hypothetical protein
LPRARWASKWAGAFARTSSADSYMSTYFIGILQ